MTASLRVGTYDDAQLAAVRSGDARIELRMALEVRRPADATVVPLREGARTYVARHRLIVERVGPVALDNLVRVRLARAVKSMTRLPPVPEDLRYALARRDGTESVPLTPSARGGTVGRMVTPGTRTRIWAYHLGTAGGGVVPTWLEEADLVIHGSEPVGRYPLSLSLTDVPPGRPDWPDWP